MTVAVRVAKPLGQLAFFRWLATVLQGSSFHGVSERFYGPSFYKTGNNWGPHVNQLPGSIMGNNYMRMGPHFTWFSWQYYVPSF